MAWDVTVLRCANDETSKLSGVWQTSLQTVTAQKAGKSLATIKAPTMYVYSESSPSFRSLSSACFRQGSKSMAWLDRTVHKTVRKWLRLPHDLPKSMYHVKVGDGGLGLPILCTYM